jgi:hypothetical protein
VLLTRTNGVPTVAVEPATVVPERLPTVIVAPRRKFVPKIVIDELFVIAYVTDAGLRLDTLGSGAVTENPSTSTAARPPEIGGFITWTSWGPGDNDVFGQ